MQALIQFLTGWIDWFQFLVVLEPYEKGILTRMGKFKKVVNAGWHFVWPFGIDEVTKENIATETIELGTQSLTTKDDKTVQVAAIITFNIFDVQKYLIDVEDADDALTDVASGYISDQVASSTWAQVRKPGFSSSLKKHIQKQARKWGIGVTNVQFSDVVQCPTLRVLQE